VPHIEDQDDKPVVVDLVEDPPVTSSDTPGSWIAYQLRGLAGVRVLREPVDDLLYSRPDGTI
jgi:hypothetical protein